MTVPRSSIKLKSEIGRKPFKIFNFDKEKQMTAQTAAKVPGWSWKMLATFLIWSILSTVSNADPIEKTPAFPRPNSIETRVNFWKKVFTDASTSYGYFHDEKDLSIIYEKFRVDKTRGRALDRKLKPTRQRYRDILRKLATGKRENLSRESLRVLNLFPKDVTNQNLLLSSERIRFQLGQADRFRKGIERMGRWETFIREIFRNRGIPERLVALPLVESSFNPNARSHAGASGLWQFTRATGKRFLQINHYIDERRDPFLSTRAAAELLKKNFDSIGTWPLAITAYNHGASGMRRAKRRLGTTNIHTIINRYKSRTFGFASKNFYAEFLAASDIEQSPETYFSNLKKDRSENRNIVFLSHFYRIEDISFVLGITINEIKALNPALLKPILRSQKFLPKGYALRIPEGINGAKMLASLPKHLRFPTQTPDTQYRVRRGDSLSVIARRFGVSESSLVRANNLLNKNKIRAGQNLKIPGKTSNRGIGADLSDYLQFTYTVKSGDTLDAIASKFNTTSDAIALANGLKNRNRINAGRIIAIPGLRPKIDLKNASEVSYIVKTGDTLGRIARYYNTTVTTLAKTNGISINDTIYPGQKLRITNAN